MKREIRSIGVIARSESAAANETSKELSDWLGRRGLDVETTTVDGGSAFTLDKEFDLVVSLGGDGTLLSVARAVQPGVLVLGVNMGHLGFLTEINRAELYPGLVRVLEGDYELEQRFLVTVEVIRGGSQDVAYRVLNDAVITKSALSKIIELTLRVDGRLVTSYRSDGLIVSTPTGSTAYNLSAGGPITHPLLPVTLLTPICPHAFTLRPVVVPMKSVVDVTLESTGGKVFLTLDGQEGTTLAPGDTVRITQAEAGVNLVKIADRTFYDSLRAKLKWGGLQTESAL